MSNDLVSSEVKIHLESVAKELSIKNYKIEVSPGSLHGDNYLGVIAKVAISGQDENEENKIINLIVKSAPRSEMYHSLIRTVYDREIYIYSKVFPEMARMQAEKGISKPFDSYPKFYKSTMSDKNEALIMEDMKQLGFELRDRRVPLNLSHVLMVMKEYGRFHALSFALRKNKPDIFQEIVDNTQEKYLNESEEMKQSIDIFCDRALESLNLIEDKIIYNKLKCFKSHMHDIIGQVLDSSVSGNYTVIGHGDSWMNNMLFKYEDSSKLDSPSKVCLLDWQLARAGSPALDLSYFIFTCTDKPFRDEHYNFIIEEYYNSLSSFLLELGCDPEELFPFNVLQEQLRKFCVYGLYMALMIVYLMVSEADEIPDYDSMTDIDTVLKGSEYQSKNIQEYYVRIKGVILDFIRFGYEFGIE